MNQVTLLGYLGQDFTLFYTEDGTAIAKNFLAITETRNQKKGNETIKTQRTDWIPIVLFGKTAENANAYLNKGDRFLGTGKIYTSSWEDQEGKMRYSWQIVIKHFEFVHNKKEYDTFKKENFNENKEIQEPMQEQLKEALPKDDKELEEYIKESNELPF